MAGALPHLERIFPALAASGYAKSSESDPAYNCFAFAVHDTKQWWEKISVRGYYWPLQRDDRLEDWVDVLRLHNYLITGDDHLEPDFEKVAIYVNDLGSPEHVARQLPSGQWTSKIGAYEDIVHETLSALESPAYGSPKVVMKRKRFVNP